MEDKNNENKVVNEHHLQMIQDVISRMAQCSFQIKGFAVTIVAAFLAISIIGESIKFWIFFAATAPAIVFWLLDAFYLHQERKYRGLYDAVVFPAKEKPVLPFCMNASPYREGFKEYLCVVFSKTILPFYIGIIVSLVAVGLICGFIFGWVA